ncbi:MAG: formyl transferase [Lutibacter sp.]|nr:formyl transferase [Lutibacter sp.]
MVKDCNIALFVSGEVGAKVLDFLIENYKADLKAVIFTNETSNIYLELVKTGKILSDICFFNNDLSRTEILNKLNDLDYFILAWWPFIFKEPLISMPRKGIINFHPSLLPYNRGKNYNFWTIIEECPFGVSLHYIDNTIDGGDILFQKKISKNWTDTGGTLYYKAQNEIVKLFCDSYANIRTENFQRRKQNLNEGSFHFEKEMHSTSKIDLEKTYVAKDLLNLLRAKTFPPHPGIWFEENGIRYELSISIKQI